MSVIADTSNLKLFSNITSTKYDELIDSLQPIILEDITKYCNNTFIGSTMYYYDDTISFSTNNNTIYLGDTNFSFSEFFKAGNIAHISGSIQNNGFYSISTAGSSFMTTNESIQTESSSSGKFVLIFRVLMPKDIPLIASRMIKHIINTQDNPGLQNENEGNYSYSLQAIGSNTYPAGIAKALDKYRKVCLY